MGKRGPAKTPTNLVQLRGNPGHRPINDKEPKFEAPAEVPGPPAFLDRYAKAEWNRVSPLLHKVGLLTEVDIMPLAAYCANYSMFVQAEKAKRIRGKLVLDFGNYECQIPEIGIASTAMKQMVTFAKEFGMTPSARTSVHIDKPEDTKDPLLEFIRGGRDKKATS